MSKCHRKLWELRSWSDGGQLWECEDDRGRRRGMGDFRATTRSSGGSEMRVRFDGDGSRSHTGEGGRSERCAGCCLATLCEVQRVDVLGRVSKSILTASFAWVACPATLAGVSPRSFLVRRTDQPHRLICDGSSVHSRSPASHALAGAVDSENSHHIAE